MPKKDCEPTPPTLEARGGPYDGTELDRLAAVQKAGATHTPPHRNGPPGIPLPTPTRRRAPEATAAPKERRQVEEQQNTDPEKAAADRREEMAKNAMGAYTKQALERDIANGPTRRLAT